MSLPDPLEVASRILKSIWSTIRGESRQFTATNPSPTSQAFEYAGRGAVALLVFAGAPAWIPVLMVGILLYSVVYAGAEVVDGVGR